MDGFLILGRGLVITPVAVSPSSMGPWVPVFLAIAPYSPVRGADEWPPCYYIFAFGRFGEEPADGPPAETVSRADDASAEFLDLYIVFQCTRIKR